MTLLMNFITTENKRYKKRRLRGKSHVRAFKKGGVQGVQTELKDINVHSRHRMDSLPNRSLDGERKNQSSKAV
jgi:hypothetical protein